MNIWDLSPEQYALMMQSQRATAPAGTDTGAAQGITGLQGGQLALGSVGTAANIWSGYQADKAADHAQKMAEEQAEYDRRRQELMDAQATRRALKSEVQGDAANAEQRLDWLGSKYTRSAT